VNVFNELRRFDAFKHLGSEGQALLQQGAVIKHSPKANAILHKGQIVSGAYIVLEGRLRVFTIAPNGTEATLYFVKSGEACVLAINCLFNDLLYPAWVQSESATHVAIIPGAVYRKLFETERSIQELTVQALSGLVYRLMAELEQIHSSNHKQRLVQFILLHAGSDGSLRMTQQHIAQHLGTTREVIARLMQEFVALGFLQSQRGSVTIRDLFALRSMIAPEPALRLKKSRRKQ